MNQIRLPGARPTAAAALLAVAAGLAACEKPAAPPMSMERPPAPVRVAEAVVGDVPVYLDQIGRVAAKETVWVRAEVSARIVETKFEDGADLKKGDLLFTLDARPFEARLAAAEASLLRARATATRAETAVLRPQATLERARAALDLAKSEFTRVEALVETKAVARSDYDARKSAVAMAQAEVEQAEADVKQASPEELQAKADVKKAEADVAMAQLDVEYCTVRSPIDGRAGRRLIDAGNLVAAAGDPLVMIERLDPVYIDFTVNENDVADVQRNMAKGALRVEARLPDAENDPRAGELTFLDNAVQEATGTLKLRATLPNSDRRFWPGRFVKVRLVLETLRGAVLVPATAPSLSARGTYLLVVKDDGTADQRIVTMGQRQGDLVVVNQGVLAGERVVTAGQVAVMPGAKVRIEAPAPVAAAAEPKK